MYTGVERAATRLVELAFAVGFGDRSNFVRTFHRLIGAPPGRHRQLHRRGKA